LKSKNKIVVIMSKKRNSKKKKGASNDTSASSNHDQLGDQVFRYTGPILSPRARAQNTRCTVIMAYTIDFTATAGGVIANVLGLQSPSSCTNWSSAANMFDEYRVLGSEVHYSPRNQYTNTVALATFIPGFVVLDRDSTAALTALASAVGYESVKEITLDHPWRMQYRMASILEATWITTTAPANRGAFLVYFTGLLANAPYGKIIQYFLVQFRGCT
jgi:hypothetical protein